MWESPGNGKDARLKGKNLFVLALFLPDFFGERFRRFRVGTLWELSEMRNAPGARPEAFLEVPSGIEPL